MDELFADMRSKGLISVETHCPYRGTKGFLDMIKLYDENVPLKIVQLSETDQVHPANFEVGQQELSSQFTETDLSYWRN